MAHIKRINEDLAMGSFEPDDAVVTICKSTHVDIVNRKSYVFSDFYNIVTNPENPWEEKSYNPDSNVVTLTFSDKHSVVSFTIEVNSEDMFDYLRENFD